MKKKIPKCLACIFAVIMFASFIGCAPKDDNKGDEPMGDNGEQRQQVILPDYDSVKAEPFVINGWYAPALTLEAYREYKDCGFDSVFLMGKDVGSVGSSQMEQALTYCDQVGLKAYVDISKMLSAVEVVTPQYIQHSSFAGFNYDEPVIYKNTFTNADGIVDIGPVVENLHKKYPQVEFLVNLNPTTSLSLNWGTPAFTYDEYIQAQLSYVNSVYNGSDVRNWLSCDDYPLFYNPAVKNPYYLKTTWLQNLEYLANAKRDYDGKLSTNFFIQSMPYGANENGRNRVPTYEDIRIQVYTLLAFGYDSVSYFCYATPPAGGEFSVAQTAMIDRSGNRTDIYGHGKKVNEEVRKLQNTYMQFNSQWLGVCPVLGTNNTAKDEDYYNGGFDALMEPLNLSRLSGVKSVSSEEDLLIGHMKDGAGNSGFMLVNYNDTKSAKKTNVTMEFKSLTKADVYRGGEKTTVNLTDGKLSLQLDIGEGVFVIPHG